jgi:hypothetical protein
MNEIIISAVKKVNFVSDGMSYIKLSARWCHIIILNVLFPVENKVDDVKHSFYEEMECEFDKFAKYHLQFFYEISVPRYTGKTFETDNSE